MYTPKLGDNVVVTRSGEKGKIVAYTTYLDNAYPDRYMLEYVAADGRATENWFASHELSAPV